MFWPMAAGGGVLMDITPRQWNNSTLLWAATRQIEKMLIVWKNCVREEDWPCKWIKWTIPFPDGLRRRVIMLMQFGAVPMQQVCGVEPLGIDIGMVNRISFSGHMLRTIWENRTSYFSLVSRWTVLGPRYVSAYSVGSGRITVGGYCVGGLLCQLWSGAAACVGLLAGIGLSSHIPTILYHECSCPAACWLVNIIQSSCYWQLKARHYYQMVGLNNMYICEERNEVFHFSLCFNNIELVGLVLSSVPWTHFWFTC
jgi:hypothetical protein